MSIDTTERRALYEDLEKKIRQNRAVRQKEETEENNSTYTVNDRGIIRNSSNTNSIKYTNLSDAYRGKVTDGTNTAALDFVRTKPNGKLTDMTAKRAAKEIDEAVKGTEKLKSIVQNSKNSTSTKIAEADKEISESLIKNNTDSVKRNLGDNKYLSGNSDIKESLKPVNKNPSFLDKLQYVIDSSGTSLQEGIQALNEGMTANLAGIANVITDRTTYPSLNINTGSVKSPGSELENIKKKYDKGYSQYLSNVPQSEASIQREGLNTIYGKKFGVNQDGSVRLDGVTKIVSDITDNTARMAPIIYGQYLMGELGVGGPLSSIVGSSLISLQTESDAYKQAKANGATDSQAVANAKLRGLVEGSGEYIIGGVLGTGAGFIDTVIGTKILKNMTNPIARVIVDYTGKSIGEGAEEFIQSVLRTAVDYITYDHSATVNWSEAAYEGLIGTLSGALMGAVNLPSQLKVAKSDINFVNDVSNAVSKVSTPAEAKRAQEILWSLETMCDERINDISSMKAENKAEYTELKNRLLYYQAMFAKMRTMLASDYRTVIDLNSDSRTSEISVLNTLAKANAYYESGEVDEAVNIIKSEVDGINDALNENAADMFAAKLKNQKQKYTMLMNAMQSGTYDPASSNAVIKSRAESIVNGEQKVSKLLSDVTNKNAENVLSDPDALDAYKDTVGITPVGETFVSRRTDIKNQTKKYNDYVGALEAADKLMSSGDKNGAIDILTNKVREIGADNEAIRNSNITAEAKEERISVNESRKRFLQQVSDAMRNTPQNASESPQRDVYPMPTDLSGETKNADVGDVQSRGAVQTADQANAETDSDGAVPEVKTKYAVGTELVYDRPLKILQTRNSKEGTMYVLGDPSRTEVEYGDDIVSEARLDEIMANQEKYKAILRENNEYAERQKESETLEADSKAKLEDLHGFDSALSPMERGRVLKTLLKKTVYNGTYMTKKEYIEKLVSEGYIFKQVDNNGNTEYRASMPGENIFHSISKTEMLYGDYLNSLKDSGNTLTEVSKNDTINNEKAVSDRYTITENEQYGSLEIKFTVKPSEAVRSILKDNKFRWNGKKGIWYGYADLTEIKNALDKAYGDEGTNTDTAEVRTADGSSADDGIVSPNDYESAAETNIDSEDSKNVGGDNYKPTSPDNAEKSNNDGSTKKTPDRALDKEQRENNSDESESEKKYTEEKERNNDRQNSSRDGIRNGILGEEDTADVQGLRSGEVPEAEKGGRSDRDDRTAGSERGGVLPASADVADRKPNGTGSLRDGQPDAGTAVNGLSDESDRSPGDDRRVSDGNNNRVKLNGKNFTAASDTEFKAYLDETKPNLKDNYAAIELLKKLEAENRKATKEEMLVLAKYKGWGGLKQEIAYNNAKLRGLLTPEEFKGVSASINNAHYTSTKVIEAMYRGLIRMGYKGGTLLEPSMGVGNFFAVMPSGLRSKTTLHGVEMDSITARIAAMLYPDAQILNSPYQDVKYPDGAFDAAIGNVPFLDASFAYKGGKYLLHDYFFVKTLDKMRDGGVVMFLTSTGTLDKLNPSARIAIAERANLIAAFRLPENAFATNAGTEVTTDMLVFQKRPKGIEQSGETFENIGYINDNMPINEYFVRHPQNILGKPVMKKDMYQRERLQVEPIPGRDFAKILNDAMNTLPKDIFSADFENAAIISENESKKPKFINQDGKIYFSDGNGNPAIAVTGKDANRASQYLRVLDAYNNLLELSTNPEATEAQKTVARENLNTVYDEFRSVTKAAIGDRINANVLDRDGDYFRVSGLERYVPDEKKYVKSDIFYTDTFKKREVLHTDSSTDALILSVNKSGDVDMEYMKKLTGKDESTLAKELANQIIENIDGEYELIPKYLSGNLREKYRNTLAAAEKNPKYKKNVEMIRAVLPKDLAPADITPSIGSTWIPSKYYAQFASQVLEAYYTPTITLNNEDGSWSVSGLKIIGNGAKKWGTDSVKAEKLFELALNMKKPSVTHDNVFDSVATEQAIAKQDEMKSAFVDWAFKDKSRREELVGIFNETFNSYRSPDYTELSKYLTFDGLSKSVTPYEHQKRAVSRVVFDGSTLLAHGVGTGKTYEMIISAMELKRLGLARKSMFVVPNNKVTDFQSDILKAYPNARVLLPAQSDYKANNRKKLFSKIATNDWDIVIIPHSQYKMIPCSLETQKSFIQEQIDEIREAIAQHKKENGKKIDTRFIKQLEKMLQQKEQELKTLLEIPRDDILTFEEMGVDALFVDEAHNFKNLGYYTSINISGAGSSKPSQRATDMFMKTSWLHKHNKRVVFATATPITNSISEQYNMTRFVAPQLLKDAGIKSFDAWAKAFGQTETKLEMSPDGRSFRAKERFSRYHNRQAMTGLFRRFTDVKKTGDVIKNLPKVKRETEISPSREIHERFLDDVQDRIKRMTAQNKKDNMLLITKDGQAMATDIRLVAPLLGMEPAELDFPDSKINKCVGNILKEYKASGSQRGTQLVFLDFGIKNDPEARYGFDLYNDITEKLKDGGIPAEEIAKIGDYDSDVRREQLFKDVNDGKIRVLIGSTAKMGEGVNVQERCVALHHLNVPFKPSDLEQRDGRIIRQGNKNGDVRIYRYIQERSFDTYMWQMIERKAIFIQQAMTEGPESELEEVDEIVLSASEAKALASGNPALLEKAEIDSALNRLNAEYRNYLSLRWEYENTVSKFPGELTRINKICDELAADTKTLDSNPDNIFSMKVGSTTFTKPGEAGKALIKTMSQKTTGIGKTVKIGEYRGMDIMYTLTSDGKYMSLRGAGDYMTSASESDTGNVARLRNIAEGIPARLAAAKDTKARLIRDYEEAKENLKKPFSKQAEYDEKKARQRELNAQLYVAEKTVDVSVNDKFESEENIAEREPEEKYFRSSADTWGIIGDKKEAVPSLSNIAEAFKNITGIPWNTGKTNGRRGVYKTHAGTIRTAQALDIPAAAHELGHYYDSKYGFSDRLEYVDELVDAFGENLQDVNEDDLPGEAVAEYFRVFLSNRSEATEAAPAFTKLIIDTLSDKERKKLGKLSTLINTYLRAGVAERYRASERTDKYVGNINISEVERKLNALKDNPGQAVHDASMLWAVRLTDRFAPIKDLELKAAERNGERSDMKIYKQYSLLARVDNLAYQALAGDEVYGLDREKTGIASLAKVLGVYLKRKQDERIYREYHKLKRAQTLVGRGIDVYEPELQKPEVMNRRIHELEKDNPWLPDAVKDVCEWERAMGQEFYVRSGLISQEAFDAMWENDPYYIPFYRVVDDNRHNGVKGGTTDQKAPIHRIKGSIRDTKDLIENLGTMVSNMVKAGTGNYIATQVADLIDKYDGMGDYMERIPPSKYHTLVGLSPVIDNLHKLFNDPKAMEAAGINNPTELFDAVTCAVGNFMSVWTVGQQKKNVVRIMRNGEPVYYEVHDKALLEMLKSENSGDSNTLLSKLVRAAESITKTMKVLTTGINLIFMVRNIIRDIKPSFVKNTDTSNPIKYAKNYLLSLGEIIRNTDDYKQYINAGGGYAGRVTEGTRKMRSAVKTVKYNNLDETKLKKIFRKFGSFLEALGRLIDITDQIPRFAAYKLAKENGADEIEAQYRAARASVDFSVGGTYVKLLDKFIPYLNAAITSMYQSAMTLSLNAKTDGGKTVLSAWLKYLGTGAFSVALVSLFNDILAPLIFKEDKEEIKEACDDLSNYMKNNYWCFYVGDGKFVRFPKSQSDDFVFSMLQRIIEAEKGDGDAFYGVEDYINNSLLPSTEIILLSDIIEIASNTSWNGTQIVPEYMKDYEPRLQYDENTSTIAIAIGDALNVSPMIIDYLIDQNTGIIGDILLCITAQNADNSISGMAKNTYTWFTNAFTTDSVYSTDIVSMFYSDKEKYDIGAKSYDVTSGGERYSYSDVYNSKKYAQFSSLYSAVAKELRASDDEVAARELRRQINSVIDTVNNVGMTDTDVKVMELSERLEKAGSDIKLSTILPYRTKTEINGTFGGAKVSGLELTAEQAIQYSTMFSQAAAEAYSRVFDLKLSDEDTGNALKEVRSALTEALDAYFVGNRIQEVITQKSNS